MSYDLDRAATNEPSLAEMTTKAMDVLASNNPKGYFLMVEGGRIDHALHETTAKKALQDTVAFDNAIKAAIEKAKLSDSQLRNTLIVVTADHDHTLVLNGYAKRTGKTTPTTPGVLGLVLNYVTGVATPDADGKPYTIIGFGNGENRVQGARSTMPSLDDTTISANTYHQEAAVPMAAGSETHGGTDVFLGAIGKGAEDFHGVIDNTRVFKLIRTAVGL
jgi:alkaline phosphatase